MCFTRGCGGLDFSGQIYNPVIFCGAALVGWVPLDSHGWDAGMGPPGRSRPTAAPQDAAVEASVFTLFRGPRHRQRPEKEKLSEANLHDFGFHVNFQGCTLLDTFRNRSHRDIFRT